MTLAGMCPSGECACGVRHGLVQQQCRPYGRLLAGGQRVCYASRACMYGSSIAFWGVGGAHTAACMAFLPRRMEGDVGLRDGQGEGARDVQGVEVGQEERRGASLEHTAGTVAGQLLLRPCAMHHPPPRGDSRWRRGVARCATSLTSCRRGCSA